MDCRVVVEAAIPVYDVEAEDEAIRIAISKTGDMLNPDLNYVEINMGTRESPSGEEMTPAFIAADEALVALELEMTVFNVEREEHASRIARKEIGQRLRNIPLKVLSVEPIPEEGEDDEEGEEDEGDADDEGDDGTENGERTDGGSETTSAGAREEFPETKAEPSDNLLPDFDEMME